MSKGATLLGLLKHVPALVTISRSLGLLRGDPAREEARAEIERLRRSVADQLAAMQAADDRLRDRVRDLESAVLTLKLLVYIGGGALAILTLVLFILLLTSLG